ncbi:MAG: SpoIID/LytB domain-containing protein [Pyrinomonadaceae bacterium]
MSKGAVSSRRSEVGSKDGGQRGSRLPPLPFALCLLPFALLVGLLPGVLFVRSETPPPAPLSVEDADEVLRRAARAALGGRDGVVLVLDAQTGRVRASAGGRAAFEEATPPGSAVKPFTMLAALRTGSLEPDSRTSCRSHYEHEGFKINCAHPRYQTDFGPAEALANSCNYYFGRAAEALDAEAYARTLREFGFGARTDAADGRESTGLLPREAAGVPEMLGESEQLRVTPAQLASAYAALFNGGALLEPREARAEGFTPALRARLAVEPVHRALLLSGMRGAVAYGTAARAGLATLPVYVFGKTGTSTPQGGWRAQGWFVGFAAGRAAAGGSEAAALSEVPADDVKLLVLVLLKRSRGSEAAEAARPVFEAYARLLRGQEDMESGGGGDEELAPSPGHPASPSDVRVRLSRGDATLRLQLEDYVFGVLAAEGSVETEAESLKALAVAARTYAVHNLRRHARDRFDLCDTTHCQRFVPVRDESARPDFYELARRAVRETAGEVLRDSSGRVAESYFSAACGGRTADVSKLWGTSRAPAHLRGVGDDACSVGAETWTDVIPAARLLTALRADERSDVGARLEGVRVVRRDPSGRAELVELDGQRRRRLRGWDFKIIVGRTLGWNVLKSSRFEVSRAGSAFVFRGTGFGHGIGLCQAGAHVSAARGAAYRQILARYFPGAAVGELRGADFGSRVDENAAVENPPLFRPASYTEPRAVASGSGLLQTALYRSTYPLATARASVQLRSEHFRVSYPARAARGEVESLVRTLEAAYADVTGRLERAGVGARVPLTEVVVYETTGDFVGATGRPAWVAAVTEGRRISFQPLALLRRRGVLGTTPRHEFVHAALEAAGAGRAPLWLVEGLAAHVAGEGRSLSSSLPRQRLTVEELERRLAAPASAQEMRALYASAYAEVSALVRREGESAVWRRALR